jgi:GNAT superfamily N-acetyltransferase
MNRTLLENELEIILNELCTSTCEVRATVIYDEIVIMLILIDERSREQGTGTAAMRRLCSLADRHQVDMSLAVDDTLGATSEERLVAFYERFGFEEAGRYGDMTRQPKDVSSTEKLENPFLDSSRDFIFYEIESGEYRLSET